MCSLEFYFGLQFGFVCVSYYLFLFSIIVKFYFIAYKYSLQEYNVTIIYHGLDNLVFDLYIYIYIGLGSCYT